VIFSDSLFLGPDLLAWLMLALGGALAVGNVAALIRPPEQVGAESADGKLRRRALVFAGIGLVLALWALATLTAR
jgi:hypothetical protein